MRRRVGVEDKGRFSINDISLGEDLELPFMLVRNCTSTYSAGQESISHFVVKGRLRCKADDPVQTPTVSRPGRRVGLSS